MTPCKEKFEQEREPFDLLQLLNPGHSGTLSTIHANSAEQGLARFTSCVLQGRVELPYRAIETNIADSLNVVVQIERRPGRRYISEMLEINSYDHFEFRKTVANKVGLGFELPIDEAVVGPNGPKIEVGAVEELGVNY